MMNAFQKMVAEEGVKSLYRGTLSSFMKVCHSKSMLNLVNTIRLLHVGRMEVYLQLSLK